MTSQNPRGVGGEGLATDDRKILLLDPSPPRSPMLLPLPLHRSPQHRPVSLGADLAGSSLYEYDPQRGEPLSAAPELCYHRY